MVGWFVRRAWAAFGRFLALGEYRSRRCWDDRRGDDRRGDDSSGSWSYLFYLAASFGRTISPSVSENAARQ